MTAREQEPRAYREVETAGEVVGREVVAEGVVELPLAGGDLPEWSPGAHIDLVIGDGLTRQAVADHEIDVRAGRPLRQIASGEGELDDALGDDLAADDLAGRLDLAVGARLLLPRGHRERRTGIELYWLRNSARTRVGSPSSARSGKRSIVCWIQSLSSRRARLAPRQKCRPRPPNAWWLSRPSRVMSNLCGSGKTL